MRVLSALILGGYSAHMILKSGERGLNFVEIGEKLLHELGKLDVVLSEPLKLGLQLLDLDIGRRGLLGDLLAGNFRV